MITLFLQNYCASVPCLHVVFIKCKKYGVEYAVKLLPRLINQFQNLYILEKGRKDNVLNTSIPAITQPPFVVVVFKFYAYKHDSDCT